MMDMEKITRAKYYIEMLANGINPLDGTPVDANDVVNDVRITRCFFFVSDILRQLIERDSKSTPKAKKSSRAEFSITAEQLQNFEYAEIAISATAIARKINWLVKEEIQEKRMKAFSYRKIVQWMLNIGMIEWREWENGIFRLFPTDEGRKIGLYEQVWESYSGRSLTIFYAKEAQEFIIDNFDAIMATTVKKGKHIDNLSDSAEEHSS